MPATGVWRRVERFVPGVGVARHYERRWLRSDLVAGLVLAAILVPQGMAYAQLAGLPPVTGLYTTIGCLVGYAIFGPSRVLVLGPDSSISPMIFAALGAAARRRRQPVEGDRARRDARAPRRGHRDRRSGSRELGFVADLLSSEVQVGYMNGLAITIIVGQLPKLFGFSTDADTSSKSWARSSRNLDETVGQGSRSSGVAVLVVLLVLPRVTEACRRCWSPSPARRSSRRSSTSPRRACRPSARCRRASRRRQFPWTTLQRRRPALRRRGRHHARVADRHDRDGLELRGPARRRGRTQPGDDRASARRTSPPASCRASRCRRAGRAPRSPSSPEPRPSSPGVVGAGVVAILPAVLQLAARRPPAVRARRGRHRRRALADGRLAPPEVRARASERGRALAC